jgi:hypothetical protein
MPAIDPSRLRHQIEHVAEAFADPARLRSRTLDLLEFYASRVRAGSGGGRTGTVRSFGVPVAVMRALQQALQERAQAEPHDGAMAAEMLWAVPVLEARWLAVALLESQHVLSLPGWIAAWAETADDPQLVARLAVGPMRRVWIDAPDLFWQSAAANLAGEGPATTVTLLALEHLLPGLAADDLPRLFTILEASAIPQAGEAWRAYLEMMRALVRRSPAETARFLVDAIEGSRPAAPRVARQLLAEFPTRQHEALREALRPGETTRARRVR